VGAGEGIRRTPLLPPLGQPDLNSRTAALPKPGAPAAHSLRPCKPPGAFGPFPSAPWSKPGRRSRKRSRTPPRGPRHGSSAPGSPGWPRSGTTRTGGCTR
jgi:hypothetical protein